jgi:hypothetical protein
VRRLIYAVLWDARMALVSIWSLGVNADVDGYVVEVEFAELFFGPRSCGFRPEAFSLVNDQAEITTSRGQPSPRKPANQILILSAMQQRLPT